jgi:hypothetical protein
LRDGKTISKILSGLPHCCGDRAPSFHNRERVDKTIGAGRTAGRVADRPIQALDYAVIAPFRRRHSIGKFRNRVPMPRMFMPHASSEQTMNSLFKKFRGLSAPAVSGTVE